MTAGTRKPARGIQAADVKAAARGRWPEVLATLGGLPRESLSGKHGPCPKCGGTDRFRFIDQESGACYCNQCFCTGNGDGISALQWARGWDFKTALHNLADYLGMKPSSNGRAANSKPGRAGQEESSSAPSADGDGRAASHAAPAPPPGGGQSGRADGDHGADDEGRAAEDRRGERAGQEREGPDLNSVLFPPFQGLTWYEKAIHVWCREKPPITREGVAALGGQYCWFPTCAPLDKRFVCIAFDARDGAGKLTGVLLVRANGKPFPEFKGRDQHKVHLVKGSKPGWLWPGGVEALKQAEVLVRVEGLTDLAALASIELPPGWLPISSSHGATGGARKLDYSIGRGKRVVVFGDVDPSGVGQEGQRLAAAGFHAAGAVEVRLPQLEFSEPEGKDLRDWLAEGHTGADLVRLVEQAPVVSIQEAGEWMGKPAPAREKGPPREPAAFEPGSLVRALDRGNIGTVLSDFGDRCEVRFVNPETGNVAELTMLKTELVPLGGEGSGEPPLPPPLSLREIVRAHPKLRPAVIHQLLRAGETANLVASPKAGKSWLDAGLALSVATGRTWLDTFDCEPGRVLIIDAELHPEVIAHRLPMVAEAMGIPASDYQDRIEVWPLRGRTFNLLTLAPSLATIEPGRYALIILDAWYRFLPPGLSENDNAAVMALYNAIDGYAGRLGAAWVNVHHASKGDQSGKGVTDVGSGAGSQSRAADTHLIIRPHEEQGVAVLEAVVRSFPPVDPVCIRWEFPTWTLATDADPRRLRDSRAVQEQARREHREARLETDRRAIVEVLRKYPEGETKTAISNACGMSRERFGPALASLLGDGNVTPVPILKSGKKTPIEGYRLCE